MSTVLSPSPFEAVAPGCRRAVVPSPWPPGSVAVFLIESGNTWLVDTGAGSEGSVAALRLALDEALGEGALPDGVILTHTHRDHAGGLRSLDPRSVIAHRDALAPDAAAGAPILAVEGHAGALPGLPGWSWVLGEGHSPGHLLPWEPERRVLLAGDQFLFGLKTPLRVADPEEDSFGGYLGTIDRVEALAPEIMWTSHTEPIREPLSWLARERRRLSRQLDRARRAVREGARTAEQVTDRTYGSIPGPGARQLLLREKLAALRHLARVGEVRRRVSDGTEIFEAR